MRKEMPIATTVVLAVDSPVRTFVSLIVFETESNEACSSHEALVWARAMEATHSSVNIEKRVSSLCRFINFHHLWFSETEAPSAEDHANSVAPFLWFRHSGTEALGADHLLQPLKWKSVSRETVRTDFTAVYDYFCFSSDAFGAVAIGSARFEMPTRQSARLQTAKLAPAGDFLAHLAPARQYWADIRPGLRYSVPKDLRPVAKKTLARPFPSLEEISELISAERNPVFRALFIAGGYGSHRISEQLNSWQIDFLPGSSRGHFFGHLCQRFETLPLYLIAHPMVSTYTDDIGRTRGPTREAVLREQYGLTPRPLLPAADKLRAGWKSKLLFGLHATTDTFWLNPVAARQFADCVQEIQDFHVARRTSRHHPYFFVNMNARRGEDYGQPVKQARVERAFAAACRRIGVTPHRYGRNIHGLRHFAKWYAEEALGLTPSAIQVIRGDASLGAQDEYGKAIAEGYSAVRAHHQGFK